MKDAKKYLFLSILLAVLISPYIFYKFSLQPKGLEAAPTHSRILSSEMNKTEQMILAEGWNILEKNTDASQNEFMIILADNYTSGVGDSNIKKLFQLDKVVDIQMVSVEYVCDHPVCSENRAMVQASRLALTTDFSRRLSVDKNVPIYRFAQDFENQTNRYNKLFNRKEFESFGFEDPGTLKKIAPSFVGNLCYSFLMSNLTQDKPLLVSKGNQLINQLLELEKVEQHLNGQYSDYPVFETKKLKSQNDGGCLLSTEDKPYVEMQLNLQKTWLLKYSCFPRSKIAVTSTLKQMREKGFTKGVMIIGKNHLVHHDLMEGESVPDLLRQENVNFIVVDY